MSLKSSVMGFALVAALVAGGCHGADPAVVKQDAIQRGDELLKKGQFADAVKAYEIGVQSDPQDGALRLKLAEASRGAQQWEKATREAIKGADLLPDNKEAQFQAVDALNSLSRFSDAIERVTPLLQRDPANPELLVLFGNAKARVLTATTALFDLQEALRLGRTIENARLRIRKTPVLADDREAERAYRAAFQIAPKGYNSRLALAGFLWLIGAEAEGTILLKTAADEAPEHAFLNRALGLFYQSQHRDADAEKYLKIAAVRDDHDSRIALADFYASKGRIDEALQMLNEMAARKDDPGSSAALRAADLELRLGRRDQAMARVEKVLSREAGNPRALQLKARALFMTKDYAQTITVARAAIVGDPNALEARLALAKSLEATGDREAGFNEFGALWRMDTKNAEVAKSLAGLALLLGRNDVALEMATQAVRLNPSDREASVRLATAQVRKGDLATADRTLAPLLAGHGGDPDLLALQGAIQAGRGNAEAARATYQRVLQSDRDSLDALTGLLDIEIKAGKVAGLRPRLEQAATRHPKDLAYQLLVGRAARAAGDAAGAQAALSAVLAQDPGHVDAALMMADVLAAQNRREEAKTTLEKALAVRPTSLDLQVSLGAQLEAMGRFPEAKARYETILITNKEAWAVSARLAAIYAELGDNLDIALKLVESARQHLPDDPDVSDTLGWIYVKKRLNTTSLPYLQQAVKTKPANAMFRYHLGVAYEALAELGKAREELSRALALDPNFPRAADARKLLAAISR